MADSLIDVLVSTPVIVPLSGAMAMIIMSALVGALVWGILLAAWPEFRRVELSSGSGGGGGKGGGGGGGGRSNTEMLIVYTFPGIATFFGSTVALFSSTVDDVVNSLAQVLSGDIISKLFLLALAVVAGYTIQNHDIVAQQLVTFQACTVNDYLDWGKEIVNLGRFGAGTLWPGFVNVPMFFLHGLLHVALHVVRDCVLESNPWQIVLDVFTGLYTFLREFFIAWGDWLDMDRLLTERVELIPAFTALGNVPAAFGAVLNCTCQVWHRPSPPLLTTSPLVHWQSSAKALGDYTGRELCPHLGLWGQYVCARVPGNLPVH